MPEKHYVRLKQAPKARSWTSERWLRRKIEQGRLAYSKADGIILVALEDIDELVERGRVESQQSILSTSPGPVTGPDDQRGDPGRAESTGESSC
jgi:hypothetical protein